MKKRPLIDNFLNNWPVKIICLLVAIFLYIFHQASLIDKKTLTIPLEIVENGIVMHVGTVPSSVSVIIKSSSNDINSIHNSDINAVVNLDSITEKGKYKLPVSITVADRLFEIDPLEIKLKNEFIEIDVDKKDTKFVSLMPSMVGEVAHGFKVSEVQMNPSYIQIDGPESVLEAIDQMTTTKINISNAETTFTTEAYLIENSTVYKVENKGPYRVTIVVSPIDHEADFIDIKPRIISLQDNLEIQNDVQTVSVRLAGSMKSLEEYIPSENFVQLNCEDITEPGEYDIPVTIKAPSYFEILQISVSSIKIEVVEKTLTEELAEEAVEGEAVLSDKSDTENETPSAEDTGEREVIEQETAAE